MRTSSDELRFTPGLDTVHDAWGYEYVGWEDSEMHETYRLSPGLMIGVLFLSLLAIGSLPAHGSTAGDAAHFLRDGLGASGRAVGSAYVALASDFTAPLWNPAPVVQSPSTVVGGGLEQRNSGLFTFSILGGRYDGHWWSAGAVVVTSDVYDVYHVSGGIWIGSASAGLGLRGYRFGIPGDRGSGLGLDLGVRYAIALGRPTLMLAAVTRDIGWTSIRWGAIETVAVDRVAWVNCIAAAVTVPFEGGEWEFELDGEFSTRRPPNDGESGYLEKAGELNVSLGTVFRWAGLHVRAGVQRFDLFESGARLRPTIGLGISVGTLSIDLALIPSSLGTTYLAGFQAEL